jgi:hypothetical protein
MVGTWRSAAPVSERREFYACVLHVFKTINRQWLRKWWKSDDRSTVMRLFPLLMSIVDSFEFSPEHKRHTKQLLTPEVALFLKEAATTETANLLKGLKSEPRKPEQEIERLVCYISHFSFDFSLI